MFASPVIHLPHRLFVVRFGCSRHSPHTIHTLPFTLPFLRAPFTTLRVRTAFVPVAFTTFYGHTPAIPIHTQHYPLRYRACPLRLPFHTQYGTTSSRTPSYLHTADSPFTFGTGLHGDRSPVPAFHTLIYTFTLVRLPRSPTLRLRYHRVVPTFVHTFLRYVHDSRFCSSLPFTFFDALRLLRCLFFTRLRIHTTLPPVYRLPYTLPPRDDLPAACCCVTISRSFVHGDSPTRLRSLFSRCLMCCDLTVTDSGRFPVLPTRFTHLRYV